MTGDVTRVTVVPNVLRAENFIHYDMTDTRNSH